jgi:AraC-like DNA-binding protein
MLAFRFLQTNPKFDAAGLRIRGIGIAETMPPSIIDRREGTGDFVFMLFHHDGEVDHHSTRAGTLALWPHDARHRYGNPGRRWRHSWVHCDGPFVPRMLAKTSVGELRTLQMFIVADPSAFDRDLLSIHEEIAGDHDPDAIVVRNLLENLIRRAIQPRSNRIAPRVPAAYERVRRYLDTHYDKPITLAELAELAALSPRHLCVGFRRFFGAPPMAYLIRRRLNAAAALLRGTDHAVGEIGRRVGYSDPFYFSKHFRSRFGVPPSAVRQRTPPE